MTLMHVYYKAQFVFLLHIMTKKVTTHRSFNLSSQEKRNQNQYEMIEV